MPSSVSQILVDRNHLAGAPLAQPHQAFVDRDSHQPCVKLRVPLKLIELFIRLQKRVLHHVFGVFAVLRDVLRNPEDLPLVLADQRVVGRDIPPRTLSTRATSGCCSFSPAMDWMVDMESGCEKSLRRAIV